MKDAVVIKSFPHGINIIMQDDIPFEEIIDDIAFKFSESKAFFGRASMALSLEGRKLSQTEERHILETIRRNSNVNIICIVGKDNGEEERYLQAVSQMEQNLTGGNEGRFYKGTLKDGQALETEESIVILGDVYPGCAVISAKNIIVLGGLYGEAYAGGNGRPGAYVVALEMEPEKLKIGDFKYKNANKTKWGIRPKVQPKIAYVKNKKIIFDTLTKELLGADRE